QENGHLRARQGRRGTVVSASAAAGDSSPGDVLDPGIEQASVAGHVGEDRSGAGRGCVAGALIRLQEKARHLSTADGSLRAVVPAAAAAGDSAPGQILDPGIEG